MTKYFYLYGDFDGDLLNRFIQFQNSYPDANWVIHLNSGGGEGVVDTALTGIVNGKKKGSVTIVGHYFCSAAFRFFYYTKCKKQLTNSSYGMMHLAYCSRKINALGDNVYEIDNASQKSYKHEAKIEIKEFEKVFTHKEMKGFKKSWDVCFDIKRLKKMFPDAEII